MKGMYPEESAVFHLPVHEALPAGERPEFFARFLTAREELRMMRMLQESIEPYADKSLSQADREEKGIEGLARVIAFQLAGWRRVPGRDGQPLTFSPEAVLELLTDVLSIADGLDLHNAAKDAVLARREELKKSASPSPSGGGDCAPGASATPAGTRGGQKEGGTTPPGGSSGTAAGTAPPRPAPSASSA